MANLVIAEHNNATLASVTLPIITAAKNISSDIDVLVAGFQCKQVAEECRHFQGIRRVIYIDHEVYEHHFAENLAKLIAELAKDYSHILAPSSTFGKDIMPRAAALLNVMQISDAIEIIDEATFVRPIYAGNVHLTVKATDGIKVLTVRSTSFAPAARSQQQADLNQREIIIPISNTVFKDSVKPETKRPELVGAKIVIAGGRGLQNQENFHLIEKLADQLGAAIGATRAAVDAGYVPNDCQVGQTGKVVAPDLYIAIGISGAIQHLAGMKDSKIIVAINKDPDAPIFQVADYGLVGDLFTVLPELEKELQKLGYHS